MLEVQTERVLVVPTSLFHDLGYFQGFSTDVDRYLGRLFLPEHVSYRPRAEVEEDPSFKQLIPYCIFRFRDPALGETVFQYTRGNGQGESRLRSKRSVGVGGHISAVDAAIEGCDPYQEGLRRELAEEVHIETPYTQRCAGMINDDLTPVGRVHLGVVHVFDVERPEILPREADIHDSGFRPVNELLADLDRFESWSQICLKALYG
jgi:predicted NUDIX family phosphoesterase